MYYFELLMNFNNYIQLLCFKYWNMSNSGGGNNNLNMAIRASESANEYAQKKKE